MLKYVAQRVLLTLPLLFVVSVAAFGLVHIMPGDPAVTILGENATPERVLETRQRLGLDDPLLAQYAGWVGDAVRGDLGTSLFSSRSVGGSIASRLPITASLTLAAIAISLLIAIPAGAVAALRRGRLADRAATLLVSAGIALPNFWVGLLLILFLALQFPLFPALGYVPFTESPSGWLRHITLPAFTLGLAATAETTRQLRSSLVDVLGQDFIRTATASGLHRWRVIIRHAAKNAAIPVVTVIGFQVAFLLGGSVIVERVFGIPGLGDLAIRSVIERDIPMVQGIVLVTAAMVLAVNLLVDLSYAYFNPKVRTL